MLSKYMTGPVQWARRNGWRPVSPQERRHGVHVWENDEKRLRVTLVVGRYAVGHLRVDQLQYGEWVLVAGQQVACWQHVVNALTVYGILPDRFNTAYLSGVKDASTLTLTRERLQALQRSDLLTWLAAIDNALRNGSHMTGANLAFHLLCSAAGVAEDVLEFNPKWVQSQRTAEACGTSK